MITSELNLGNLKSKDLTGKVDFSNVEVGFIGGLPTFIPTEETERISVEEAIEYLGKIPIPRLMSNTLEDCIEQNKYVLAIKMAIEALAKEVK